MTVMAEIEIIDRDDMVADRIKAIIAEVEGFAAEAPAGSYAAERYAEVVTAMRAAAVDMERKIFKY